MLVQKELKNAYIGIPNPTSIVLDKSSISLTTIGQTEQLTATIEPTISDHSVTWSSDDTTVATVSTTGLVTCVTPGTATITATTVNGLTATCSVGQGRLPSAYQEVEYIQSSGTQYFIVGSSFKTSYKSVIDFQMTQTGGDQVVIGFNFSPYRYGINAYARKFKVITGSTSGWSNTISEDTNRHTLTIDKNTATVDSNNYTISGYTDVTVNGGIGVFAHNDEGIGHYFASVKIYNLEIYDDNGAIIYHLVPCYRKSDSVIGMYDLVNDQFYTNSGTGTFTKGQDV